MPDESQKQPTQPQDECRSSPAGDESAVADETAPGSVSGGTPDLAEALTRQPASTIDFENKDPSRPLWPQIEGYELLGVLGRGGMGVVYKARQLKLNRTVALKMVLAGAHASEDAIARFLVEAKAVAGLQHPNIVQVFDLGEWNGQPYFAMEYIDGRHLGQRIADHQFAYREAAEIVECLARAMQYAHDQGVVHRDLKPSNILLSRDGTPRITDFGLAKQLGSEGGLTKTGAVLGTPGYLSPEQAAGKTKDIGPATDVFALGVILYELIAGRRPFVADSELEVWQQVLERDPPSPAWLRPSVPRDLETICLKCLEKEVHRRYSSAAELAHDLRRYLNGEPIVAKKHSITGRMLKLARRHRAASAAAVVACVALVAAGTCWLGFVRHSHAHFANWVMHRRIPEGFNEVTGSTLRHRNVSYRLKSRGWWGPVIEVAAVNGVGREVRGIPPMIGNPLDTTHQVASVEFQYSEGRVSREIGRDQHGQIVWQAAYHYDGDGSGNCRAEFLNADNVPQPLGESMATSVRLAFNDAGYMEEAYFTGAFDEAQPNDDGSFGAYYEYNQHGLLKSVTYLSKSGTPMRGEEHMFRMVYDYDTRHQLVGVAFQEPADPVDAAVRDDWRERMQWRPALHAEGYYGWRSSYDQFGNEVKRIFVDAEARPMRRNLGFAGVIAEYDDRGNQSRFAYLDLTDLLEREVDAIWNANEPVLFESVEGHAGWRSEFNDGGYERLRLFIDNNKAPTVTTDGYAGWRSEFDSQGNETSRTYLGIDGQTPSSSTDGYSHMTWDYGKDQRGDETKLVRYWVGTEGNWQPFVSGEGIAGQRETYDARGNVTLVEYIGTDGQATLHKDGEAGWRATYDIRGHRTGETYFNLQGDPTLFKGYSGWRAVFNDIGLQEEYSYRGLHEELVVVQDGYAGWTTQYDERGNATRREYFGPAGPSDTAVSASEGIAGWIADFDERGNETSRIFIAGSGERVYHNDGSAGWTKRFDECGRQLEFAYRDHEGNYLTLTDGFAGYTSEYNARGQETRRTYFGRGGPKDPVPHIEGNFGWTAEYDTRGNQVTFTYVDQRGRPTVTRTDRVAGWHATFDQWNREIVREYFNESREPAPHADGNYQWTRTYDVHGRPSQFAYRDKAGELMELGDGTAGGRSKYDQRGNWLSVTYFDDQGNETENKDGVAVWGADYDTRGRMSRNYYLDLDSHLVVKKSAGYAGWSSSYDDFDRETQRVYFGVDEKPIKSSEANDGTSGWEMRYDSEGNCNYSAFLDENEDPVVNPAYGYAGWESQYDDRRRECDRSYFDAAGDPVETLIVVGTVLPGLQAEKAGILPGDVVLSYHGVAGTAPRLGYERMLLVESEAPPKSIEILIRRDGEEKAFQVSPGWLGLRWDDYAVSVIDSELTTPDDNGISQ